MNRIIEKKPNESFLNVRGEKALLDALRGCWASLYGARVIFYRRQQQIPEEKIAIAVIVQQMVDSAAAGVWGWPTIPLSRSG